MKLSEFLSATPVTLDAVEAWDQRGYDKLDDAGKIDLITKKLGAIRQKIAKSLKKNPLDLDKNVTFARKMVPDASIGEWVMVADGPTFTWSSAGFVNESDIKPTAEAKSDEPAAPVEKETRTPKEIQDAIPFEQRHGWTNYDLQDQINERVCQETVDYLESH